MEPLPSPPRTHNLIVIFLMVLSLILIGGLQIQQVVVSHNACEARNDIRRGMTAFVDSFLRDAPLGTQAEIDQFNRIKAEESKDLGLENCSYFGGH